MAQTPSIAEESTATQFSSQQSITLRIAKYNPEHDSAK